MSDQLNHTTVIDFSANISDIGNLKLLPPEVQEVIGRATRIDRRGLQELIGRVDRSMLWSACGRYRGRSDRSGRRKFEVKSIDWKDKIAHWRWSEGMGIYQVTKPNN